MKQRTVKVIIALSILLAVPSIQAECPPSLIGSPCAHGGLATASQIEPGITLAAGNPVHLVTGNKYQQDIDLPPNPTLRGLELIRHYNAMDVRPSVLGHGWALSYDTRLHRVGGGWQIVQADGSRVDFPASSADADGVHRAAHGILRPGIDQYDWLIPSGHALSFDRSGYLIAVQWPIGESVHVIRHSDAGPLNNTIQTVQNDQGQELAFHYTIVDQQARLTAVDTPLGRFSYTYDTPPPLASTTDSPNGPKVSSRHRLVRVERPDGMQRHYLHEVPLQAGHPYALTGIEIVSPATQDRQRTGTWSYDTRGRVIESISTDAKNVNHQLRFDYRHEPSRQQDGLTVVDDASRGRTRFHTAIRGSRHVLTSVQGSGCFGCAAPGTQADYDSRGRLTQINGTRIERSTDGTIQTLQPAFSGWPGLTLRYNNQGLRERWHSDVTGTEHMRYDDQALPVERRFANGDTVIMEYDILRRPTAVHEKQGNTETVTHLAWQDGLLTRIVHPGESETRRYDKLGRIRERTITRPAFAAGQPLQLSEQFRYDIRHRLALHQLPEGGLLQYDWGQGAQLKAIYWQDVRGRRHTILETRPGKPGYRYGNGLHLDTVADEHHRVRQLRLRHQDQLIWMQDLDYDAQQRIVSEHHARYDGSDGLQPFDGDAPRMSGWHYAYDAQSRLIGYRRTGTADKTPNIEIEQTHPASQIEKTDASSALPSEAVWLAWQADGSSAAIRNEGVTRRPGPRRDASGLAVQADGFDLSYGPNRRLQSVSRAGKPVATYRHNAFGYRISRKSADGPQTEYIYLNNQLVAEAVTNVPEKTSLPRITRRYVYAHQVPVAVIDYSPDRPEGQVYAVHADLQGAPRLMTDEDGRIRWQAEYSPLGKVINVSGDMQLDLRLPGQIADPDTGWHDNLLRTYMPEWGHYLEPDPLGPVPGNQAYGYASQQPRRYADPMGLLLFAFDGTRQTADTQSNVWKMSQYYLDGPVHYHPGPGNAVFIDWDTLTARQAEQIIETQWKWLLYELSRPQVAAEITPIDILGFSRGAALARHFGNLIAQNVHQGLFQFNDPFFGAISACVDLRFMGLFDTVAQFGIAGSQNRNYDLSIAPAWEWVAHAVALHERRWLFPLTAAGKTRPDNVIEAPFIGAHSDIGGGVLPPNQGQPGGRSDLSNVALNWMIWQARAASVPLGDISNEHGSISQPILHDFRTPVFRTTRGDRRVDAPNHDQWLAQQNQHPHLGRETRSQTEKLIRRHENWRTRSDPEVGMVDMNGYARWLQEELGWQALPV